MPVIKKLPGRLDDTAGLLELADVFGDAAVFDLIMLCRTARGEGQDPGGEALTILGNRLLERRKAEHPEESHDQARQAVAHKLGFQGGNPARTNFYKILAGGRRRAVKRRA